MSVPFFKDFNKKTKSFFKQSNRDEYDLGSSLNIKIKNEGGVTFKGKLKQTDTKLDQKLTVILNRKFGSIEVEENGSKISATVNVPKIYKEIDLETKHTNKEVNITLKYKPKNNYYNARIKGDYIPNDKKNNRLCKADLSFAVGDDSLNLNVGAQLNIKDVNGASDYDYKLGFLYTPNKQSQYSVTYKPDGNDGLDYEFDLYRRLNENVELAARASGKVDTSISELDKPVLSVGAGFSLKGGNRLQGFVNSVGEYGLLYRANVVENVGITFGVSAYKQGLNDTVNPRLGYKLEI